MPRLLAIILLLLVTPAAAQEKSTKSKWKPEPSRPMETLRKTPLGLLTQHEQWRVYDDLFRRCYLKAIEDYDDHISDARTVADYIVQAVCVFEVRNLVEWEKEAKRGLTEEDVRTGAHQSVMGNVLRSRAHPGKYGGPKK